jgi:DNA-binding MarR family transcriptional regulator
LEKQGYIEKEIKAEDRRNKIITFTEKGNCFAIPILEELKLAEIEAFSGISYMHRVNIIENLAVLIHALSKKFK